MKSSALIACLILGWIQSFGQSIQRDRVIFTLNSHQVRAILKDHAELEMRRSETKIDSASYQAMLTAFYFKDSAFHASQLASRESDRIAQDYAKMYHESDKAVSGLKKEVRRQKRIKIITMIGAGVVLLLSFH